MASVTPSGFNPGMGHASVSPYGFSDPHGEFYEVKYKGQWKTIDRFDKRYKGFDPSNPVNTITSKTYQDSYNSHHQHHKNKTRDKVVNEFGRGLRIMGRTAQVIGTPLLFNPETALAGQMLMMGGADLRSSGREVKRINKIAEKGKMSKKDAGKLIQNLPLNSKLPLKSPMGASSSPAMYEIPVVTASQVAVPEMTWTAVTRNVGKFDF